MVAVRADDDALESTVCPDTVSAVAVVVASVEVPVTERDPPIFALPPIVLFVV